MPANVKFIVVLLINASETGPAEGVPIALSRGRSVEFPILREPWLHV